MAKINFVERNELALFIRAEKYKEEVQEKIYEEIERNSDARNEAVKLELADELKQQGISNEAICHILNLNIDQLKEDA